MADALDDVAFLARSENRVAILDALRETPATRPTLQDRLDLDRVTLARILSEFEERGWVATDDDEYAVTFLGEMVADEFAAFRAAVAAADDLQSLVGRHPVVDPDFPADRLVGATVTTAGDGDPYAPVRRFVTLLREADSLRGYDTTTIAPMYVDDIREQILGGMTTEVVYRPSVIDQLVADHREDVAEVVASGYLTLWVAESLPCGLAIFDERVAIGVYDDETGMLEVLVDTDDEAVREWALDSFGSVRADAVALDEWLDDPLA